MVKLALPFLSLSVLVGLPKNWVGRLAGITVGTIGGWDMVWGWDYAANLEMHTFFIIPFGQFGKVLV